MLALVSYFFVQTFQGCMMQYEAGITERGLKDVEG